MVVVPLNSMTGAGGGEEGHCQPGWKHGGSTVEVLQLILRLMVQNRQECEMKGCRKSRAREALQLCVFIFPANGARNQNRQECEMKGCGKSRPRERMVWGE